MNQYCSPCVVAGHSYGGAFALQLGADYPNQVATVLSIAGTGAAPYQRPKWYTDFEHSTSISNCYFLSS